MKCYNKAGDFPPVFNNIFTPNILGMQEKKGDFTPHARVLHPSKAVSQYRCINLPKTDGNDRTHKNDPNTLS